MQAAETAEIGWAVVRGRGNVLFTEDAWWRSWSGEFLLLHELGG